MDRKRLTRGISTAPVVLLLALIVAGGFNYRRNMQAEEAVPRPYKSYSQADLEALLNAYEAENAAAQRQYEAAKKKSGHETRVGHLDQNIATFEAVQRQSSRTRELGVVLSMQQTATGEIEAELARRKSHGAGLQLHLNRLLTI